jgi:hypothetical protein
MSRIDIGGFLSSLGENEKHQMKTEKLLGHGGDQITHHSDFLEAFLAKVEERACIAQANEKSLVILYFGPVTPEQDLCIDIKTGSYLTLNKLRHHIRSTVGGADIPVVLVSTSALTAGWVCKPAFCGPSLVTTPEDALALVAKNCGGVFASRLIAIFKSHRSPLIPETLRSKLQEWDIMPTNPTDPQVQRLNEFHMKLHSLLKHRFSPLAQTHGFEFCPEHDAWTIEYGPRVGRSLQQWALNHDGNIPQSRGLSFLASMFGGTFESQMFHLEHIIKMELNTCDPDWCFGHANGTLVKFQRLLDPGCHVVEQEILRIFDIVEFRASSNILATLLAAYFDLKIPTGQDSESKECRFWKDNVAPESKFNLAFQTLRHFATTFDTDRCGLALFPGETAHDTSFLRYYRAPRWLAAAVSESCDNLHDVEYLLQYGEQGSPLVFYLSLT